MTQAEKILARLEEAPATSRDLNAICFRFSARIHELRKLGHDIRSERIKDGLFRFTLVQEKKPLVASDSLYGLPEQKLEAVTLFDVPQKKPNQDWR